MDNIYLRHTTNFVWKGLIVQNYTIYFEYISKNYFKSHPLKNQLKVLNKVQECIFLQFNIPDLSIPTIWSLQESWSHCFPASATF